MSGGRAERCPVCPDGGSRTELFLVESGDGHLDVRFLTRVFRSDMHFYERNKVSGRVCSECWSLEAPLGLSKCHSGCLEPACRQTSRISLARLSASVRLFTCNLRWELFMYHRTVLGES